MRGARGGWQNMLAAVLRGGGHFGISAGQGIPFLKLLKPLMSIQLIFRWGGTKNEKKSRNDLHFSERVLY